MLDSHSISSLNNYREIPFSRLINFYFGFARRIGKQNKYTLLNMPANCPIKYTLLNGQPSLLFTRCRALAARHPANSVMGRASSPSPAGDFSMGWMPLLWAPGQGVNSNQPSESMKTLLIRCLEFWAYYSYTRYKQMPVDHFRKWYRE